MHNLTNVANYIAYAAGFAMGNFVGISIERRLFAGSLMVRVVAKRDASMLIEYLNLHGYGVTSFDAHGAKGPVKIIFTVVDRNDLGAALSIVKEFNPNAFYTIEDIRYVAEQNIFPTTTAHRNFLRRFNGSFQKRK